MAILQNNEITSAPEATEIAVSFVKKYRSLALPLKAVREGDIWLVELDVGPLLVKVAKIKVHAKTRDIPEYSIPS